MDNTNLSVSLVEVKSTELSLGSFIPVNSHYGYRTFPIMLIARFKNLEPRQSNKLMFCRLISPSSAFFTLRKM